jgi:hypothetical protein
MFNRTKKYNSNEKKYFKIVKKKEKSIFFFFILGSCGKTTSLVTNKMNFDELCRTIDQPSEFITLFCKF